MDITRFRLALGLAAATLLAVSATGMPAAATVSADDGIEALLVDSPTATPTPPSGTPTPRPTVRPGDRPGDKPGDRPGDKPGDRKPRNVTYTGNVTAKGASDLTVKDRNGRIVIATVDSATKYKQEGNKSASFGDVKTGMQVAVYGTLQERQSTDPAGTYRIKALGVQLPRIQEKFIHVTGEITALSDTSVTVKDPKSGRSYTAMLNAQTKKEPKNATFAVGDRVLMRAKITEGQGTTATVTAQQLVKLPQPPVREPGKPEPSRTPNPSTSPTVPASPTATASPTTSPTATSTATR